MRDMDKHNQDERLSLNKSYAGISRDGEHLVHIWIGVKKQNAIYCQSDEISQKLFGCNNTEKEAWYPIRLVRQTQDKIHWFEFDTYQEKDAFIQGCFSRDRK